MHVNVSLQFIDVSVVLAEAWIWDINPIQFVLEYWFFNLQTP